MRIENRHKAKFAMKGRVVFFGTGNIHKFNEVRSLLTGFDIAVGMLRLKDAEIQNDSLKEIAQNSAKEVFKRCHLPIIVEDAGLFINTIKGFPGPYSAYVYKTIGNKGLLQLIKGVKDRKAVFRSAVAYCDSEHKEAVVFEGEATGKITKEECSGSGKSGFGFDPIFQPDGRIKTFAEMTLDEKNDSSHRAKAFRKFAEWYKRFR